MSRTKKYEFRPFYIDGVKVFWQRMWGSDGALCCRFMMDFCSDDAIRRKYEKRIRVPKPGLTKEEKTMVSKLFRMTGVKDKDKREIVLKILTKERQDEAARVMIEELAKADWEKYGNGKARR